jgi:peroxiredoxin
LTNTESAILPVGTPAPDFTLNTTPDQTVSLSDFRGQPVVLVFYPADFSPVCGDQLALYNQVLPMFRKHADDVQLLAISVDGVWCHQAYAHDRKLKFPLLSDFHPQGATAKRFGVYDEATGTSKRALFVLDTDGTITWSYVSPAGINPGADGILEALKSLPRKG